MAHEPEHNISLLESVLQKKLAEMMSGAGSLISCLGDETVAAA